MGDQERNSGPGRQEKLLELYKVTAEDYRFQIDLNWRRSQSQKAYYRAVRDARRQIERDLGLDDRAARPTSGDGSFRNRLGRVTTFQTAMLTVIAAFDAVGAFVALS